MSRASRDLAAATEHGRSYRMSIHWTAADFGPKLPFHGIIPPCACGCRRPLRGDVETHGGKGYLAGHAASPAVA